MAWYLLVPVHMQSLAWVDWASRASELLNVGLGTGLKPSRCPSHCITQRWLYIYGVPPNATDWCIHVPVSPVIIGLDNGSTPDKATDHYVNQRWLSVYRVVNSVRLSDPINAPVSLVNIGFDNGLASDRPGLLYNPMVTFYSIEYWRKYSWKCRLQSDVHF